MAMGGCLLLERSGDDKVLRSGVSKGIYLSIWGWIEHKMVKGCMH